jgi:hypothetical protein
MAVYNSNIVVPTICPLTFTVAKTNTTVFPSKYMQRFGSTDPLHVQFLSSQDLTDTFYLKCYSASYDTPIYSVTFTKSTLLAGSYYYWDAYVNFSTILTAITALGIHWLDTCVYFRIETDTDVYMDSQPVLIESQPSTIGILYHNTKNDFETVFGTWSIDNSFLVRIEGGFGRGYFQVSGDYETFMNQKKEPSVVYSMPFSTYKLSLGDAKGFDDAMMEKLNYIFHLDTLIIGGIQYVRIGEMQQTLKENGLWNASVNLVPATNRMTQNIEGDVQLTTQDGTLITDEDSNVLIINDPFV